MFHKVRKRVHVLPNREKTNCIIACIAYLALKNKQNLEGAIFLNSAVMFSNGFSCYGEVKVTRRDKRKKKKRTNVISVAFPLSDVCCNRVVIEEASSESIAKRSMRHESAKSSFMTQPPVFIMNEQRCLNWHLISGVMDTEYACGVWK